MYRKGKKPIIIITGASGFIGKYLINFIKEDYTIIAIARRSSTESGVPFHQNINWVQWDIANDRQLNEVMGYIMGKGGANYLIHLAAFYDFEYEDNPEYQRTNITGTRNILELAKKVGVEHYIFASSLTVSKFPENGIKITEKSTGNANFAYATSKIAGEEMAKKYTSHFYCSMIRFAAVYSDWCEYAPLYKFLQTWLSSKWDSRILAGKGQSAISYIHIHDLCKLLIAVIKKHKKLSRYGIYIASPNGSTSHKELYTSATRDYFGEALKPVLFSKFFTYPGLMIKKIMGRLGLIAKPYEKFWMLKYIDLQLDIDASATMEELEWQPTPRYHILRRLLFLLEKMKSHPNIWHFRNEAALKTVIYRANLTIYEQMVIDKDEILNILLINMRSRENANQFPRFSTMDIIEFQSHFSTLYHLLMAAVRSGDRSIMLKYIDEVALQRFTEGFELEEVLNAMSTLNIILTEELQKHERLEKMGQELYDYISLTIQLAMDEIEDVYENLEHKLASYQIDDMPVLIDMKKKEAIIEKLSAFYQESQPETDTKEIKEESRK